jgi:hypothetical protein
MTGSDKHLQLGGLHLGSGVPQGLVFEPGSGGRGLSGHAGEMPEGGGT